MCSNNRKNLTKSSISQFAISAQLISFKIKTTKLNRVSIFFHEISRINVELNFDLKFRSRILSWAFKKIGGQSLKNVRQISEFGRQILKRPSSKFHPKI